MSYKKFFPIAFVLICVTGCKTMQPPNFTPSSVGLASKKADADLRAVTVSFAQPEEQTGKVKVARLQAMFSTPLPPLWKEGLQDALARSAIFSDDSKNKVSLLVKITEFDPPTAGLTFPTPAAAKYEILDRKNGAIVFTTTIRTIGECEVSHDFVGAVRSVEAMNRAVQMNIVQFIQQLEASDLSKPIIPGRQ